VKCRDCGIELVPGEMHGYWGKCIDALKARLATAERELERVCKEPHYERADRERASADHRALVIGDLTRKLVIARADALEEAARKCDEHGLWVSDPGRFEQGEAAVILGALTAVARTIRALIRHPPKETR
jgi:hypothetical protein